ncbi:MAG: hypothetical protein H0T51_14880, partial [Pirellulales bacterium]|nr:hypothetical protein [Pirellulales bacterium]
AALDSVMEERGLTSYVFNELPAEGDENRELNGDVPGVTFTSLAAAKNEQGRLSRSLGGSFVHVELDADVRADGARRKLAGSAIAAVIHSAAKPPDTADLRQLADAKVEPQRAGSSARLSSPQAPTPANLAAADDDEAAKVVAEAPVTAKPRDDEAHVRIAAKPVREEQKTLAP